MRLCDHGSAPGRCGFPECRHNPDTLVPSNHSRYDCERCGATLQTVQRGASGPAFFPEHVCAAKAAA